MSIQFPEAKGPGDTLDHVVNWAPMLDGDTIVGSTWVVPSALTGSNESFTTTTTTIWLSGGVAGQNYNLKNTITTAAGRVVQRTIELKVEDR